MKAEEKKTGSHGYVLGFLKPDGIAQVQQMGFACQDKAVKTCEAVNRMTGSHEQYQVFELWPINTR